MATLLVASGGGHLAQLHRLLPRLDIEDERTWVTFDTALARSLLRDEDVRFAPFARPHDLVGTIRDARFGARLLRTERFGRAVSTGANLAVALLPLARLHGARAQYIESATRSAGPSLSGRMLQRVPGIELYTQHRSCAVGRWRFAGSVFDGFHARALDHAPRVRRLVVTVGVNESHGFPQLVERLQEIVPREVHVLWQIGNTAVDVPGARRSVPADELRAAMEDADAVVAHAGTGSALAAMDAGRLPLLVPRRPRHDEHVDDHQRQTAEQLQAIGLASAADVEELTWGDIEATARWHVEQERDLPPLLLR